MKTQKEVKDYALAASSWLYVWGANGEQITKALMDRLYRDYGSASYPLAYYNNKLAAGAGKIAADCSGFMMPLSGYDATAQGYYEACTGKASIADLPKDKVCLVFKRNSSGRMYHIGIYLGDGTVAEMASSAANYQHRALSAVSWTHWGQPEWIDYSASAPVAPVQSPADWQHDDKGWRYRKADGSYLKSDWEVINHHWYYFGPDGYMLTGWHMIDGKWYYLEASGEYEGACWHEAAGGKGALERWYVV